MNVTDPASMNHNDPQLSDTPAAPSHWRPLADQLEVATLDLRRGLVPRAIRHRIPSIQDSQRSLETAVTKDS
jgi:hypothetical protein